MSPNAISLSGLQILQMFYFRRYVKMPGEDDKWWMVEKDGKMVNGNSDDEDEKDSNGDEGKL